MEESWKLLEESWKESDSEIIALKFCERRNYEKLMYFIISFVILLNKVKSMKNLLFLLILGSFLTSCSNAENPAIQEEITNLKNQITEMKSAAETPKAS